MTSSITDNMLMQLEGIFQKKDRELLSELLKAKIPFVAAEVAQERAFVHLTMIEQFLQNGQEEKARSLCERSITTGVFNNPKNNRKINNYISRINEWFPNIFSSSISLSSRSIVSIDARARDAEISSKDSKSEHDMPSSRAEEREAVERAKDMKRDDDRGHLPSTSSSAERKEDKKETKIESNVSTKKKRKDEVGADKENRDPEIYPDALVSPKKPERKPPAEQPRSPFFHHYR